MNYTQGKILFDVNLSEVDKFKIRLESQDQDIIIPIPDERHTDECPCIQWQIQNRYTDRDIQRFIRDNIQTGKIINYIDGDEVNRDNFFEALMDMAVKHIEARDAQSEAEIKEQILEFIATNKDIEFAYDLPANYNPHR